jgi:hypothetical protein
MRDNNMTTLLVVLLLIAAFMMGAVVAAASPAVEATNDLDDVSELEIEDTVYSDGDEIIPSSPSPASFGTSSPPLGSSSSPFVEPPIEHRGRLPNATGQGDDAGSGTGIGLNNTGPTTSTNITETTSTASFTAQPTTQTNGLLTASLNGTHFTTNQTIAVNGTVGEAAGPFIAVYVELKDPQDDTLAFDFAPIVRNNEIGADNETSFSYSLVAGHDDSDAANSDSGSHNRRFWKPMNETGNNYTMIVGYATPVLPSSSSSSGSAEENSRSEVQLVFDYEHLLPPEEEGAAAVATTTTPAEESEPEPVVEPEEPEEEESDDGEDCDDSYPDECIPPPPPVLDCSDIDEEDFEVQGSDPHGFDDDNNGVGCEAEDSSSSSDDSSSSSDDDSNDDDDDDNSDDDSSSSSDDSSSSSSSSNDDNSDNNSDDSSDDDSSSSSSSSTSSSSSYKIDGNSISNALTNKLDDIFGDDNDNNSNRP